MKFTTNNSIISGMSEISNIYDDTEMNKDILNNVEELMKMVYIILNKNHTS